MALDPNSRYPANTGAPDADYPLGSAVNVSEPGAGDGTPLEKDWVNDLWGFLQSLLDEAELAADGNPDKVGASQYLDAVLAIIAAVASGDAGAVQAALDAHTTATGTNVHGLGTMSTRAQGTGDAAHRTNVQNDGRFARLAQNLADLPNAAGARGNLGAAATIHNHSASNITSGTLPVNRGGTGQTTMDNVSEQVVLQWTIQADPGGTPSGSPGDVFAYY